LLLNDDEIKVIEDTYLARVYQKFLRSIVKGEGAYLYDINGKKFGEYVGDRGVHADLPLDEIDKDFREKYEMYRMFLDGSVKLDDTGKLI